MFSIHYLSSRLVWFLGVSLAGVLLLPVFFHSVAQAIDPTIPGVTQAQIDNALKDLSAATGQSVTSKDQAHAICDQEKYFTTCADIGKKYGLYQPAEVKQVDTLLAELKGKLTEDIKRCTDAQCLVNAANQLAKRIGGKDPALASQLDLTTEKISQTQAVVTAAKEAGVKLTDCQTLDPDSASVELLRTCARLAKDTRVQQSLPESARQVASFDIDKTLQLKQALAGGQLACGDGTLDGCGKFCLNPPTAASPGGNTIPPVCRQIAQQFFGPEGVRQLEQAHNQVSQLKNSYETKLVLVAPDGKEVIGQDNIRQLCDQAFQNKDIASAKACGDFAVKNGFASQTEVNDGLKLIQNFASKGQNTNFDDCLKNPQACQNLIPKEKQAEFQAGQQIQQIMTQAIGFDAQQCQNPASADVAQKCLDGSRRALSQLETLNAQNPTPGFQKIISQIKQGVDQANQYQQHQGEIRQVFQQQGGPGGCRSEEECRAYCSDPAHSPECIAFGAKQGLYSRGEAAQKFQQFNQTLQGPQTNNPSQNPTSTNIGPDFGRPEVDSNRPSPECLAAIQSGDFVKAKTVCTVNTPPPTIPLERGRICPLLPSFTCPAGYYHRVTTNSDGCAIEGPCIPVEGSPNPSYSPYPTGSYSPGPYPSGNYPPPYNCPDGQYWDNYTHTCNKVGSSYSPYPSSSNYPTPSGGGGSWADHTWTFTDGTAFSSILNRTDSEYTSYIAKIEAQCRAISKSKFNWRPGAGNSNPDNWQNFGIPDCSGTATPYPSYTPYPSGGGTNWVNHIWTFSDGTTNSYILNRTDSEYTSYISSVEAQCRSFSKNRFVWRPGAGTDSNWRDFGIPDCSGTTTPTPSYTPYPSGSPYPSTSYTPPPTCPSGQYWDSYYHACKVMSSYSPYPSTSSSYTPPPACPDGQYWDNYTHACKATTCGSGQYWNGTSCVPNPTTSYTPYPSSSTTTCGSGQYWNGTACVNSPSYSTAPTYSAAPTSNPAAGCTSVGGTWTGTTCQMPSTSPHAFAPLYQLTAVPAQRWLISTMLSCQTSGGQWNMAEQSCQASGQLFADLFNALLNFFR